MTVRFGRVVLEYKPDGMVRSEEGDVEYQYSPNRERKWYSSTNFLYLDGIELDSIKVMA